MIAGAVALPGILANLAPALNHYGYFAVIGLIFLEDFGVPVPGETILLAAAVYAGAGQLNPILVGVLALIGAVAGDNVGYLIGHLIDRTALIRYGRFVFLTEDRLARVEHFFDHHGGKIIIFARFIEGLRQANGIVAGLTGMKWPRFFLFNCVGALLWVSCWMAVGLAAGSHLTTIYKDITRYSLFVGLVALIVAIGIILFHRNRRQRVSTT